MFGQPSLRRRLILSYLLVVVAVTAAGFVTVQVLVPQFFEQAVQERLGPGPQDGQNQQQGQTESPGQGEGQDNGQGQSNTTTTVPADTSAPDNGTTPTTTTTTSAAPTPTGSTIGPGAGEDPGNGDDQSDVGNGEPGGNPDPGNPDPGNNGRGGSTTTTVDAFGFLAPGLQAAGPITSAQRVEQSPVPAEIQEDYDRALTGALVVATVIGLVIALAMGIWLTRRLMRTFNGIKEGASRLADGHYGTRVAVPRETELADLAESVNTLAHSLERTEQTRARLVSDLAHEIRNPLSTIEGYMEGLIDGVMPASKETYEAIAAEAHRLKRLTWDLSTLSKAQEGAIEYSYESVDLGDVAAKVVETLGPQYEINSVALLVDSEGPLPVRVDADRMAQAITNLLGNALAHTPPGGRVRVTLSSTDQQCVVAIADTGSGIPAGQLETIFDRFTRLDRGQPGTGIGLNIARTLVRVHGGDVTATSPGPDLGSTFTISLPRRTS